MKIFIHTTLLRFLSRLPDASSPVSLFESAAAFSKVFVALLLNSSPFAPIICSVVNSDPLFYAAVAQFLSRF